VRGDTFGCLQRSFNCCVSDEDQREVVEKAVQFAMWGQASGSVTIKRTGFYSVDYELVLLDVIAGKTRVLEGEFISANDIALTDAFRRHLRQLLGSGMADAFRLWPHAVAKVLNPGRCACDTPGVQHRLVAQDAGFRGRWLLQGQFHVQRAHELWRRERAQAIGFRELSC
jgi:hypothetical protein